MTIRQVQAKPLYAFDRMRHGDAIKVESPGGAREMFRRWRHKTGRKARLTSSKEKPKVLYFIEEASPRSAPSAARSPRAAKD